ncbi:MAG TPA: hypothetical protein VL171_06375 [Verrucomicrobiae bacterium]|nr:hypothetical protein [Verrucomicrobiae bacterium]
MKEPAKRILFWTPRILGILYAAFISIFALDVFGAGYGFWGTVAALLIHLIPTGLLLLALIIAWRWECVGGLLYIGLGLWYSSLVWHHHPGWIQVIAGPVFLTGILFFINWLYTKELPTGS